MGEADVTPVWSDTDRLGPGAVAPAWADDAPSGDSAAQQPEESGLALQIKAKLARGLANLGFGWLEMSKQIQRVGQEQGWLAGIFRCPIEGLGMVVARTFAGMYELFSFLIPIPPHYQPLMQPEFVWQPEPAWPVRSASPAVAGATETNSAVTP